MSELARVNLSSMDRVHHGAISFRSVRFGGTTVAEVTLDVGAVWSKDIGSIAGARFCSRPHTGLILSGQLHVVMIDGHEEDFVAGDAMFLPPGHDVWAVGSQPCVFVEFSDEGQ